jgi:hypothetical protein
MHTLALWVMLEGLMIGTFIFGFLIIAIPH